MIKHSEYAGVVLLPWLVLAAVMKNYCVVFIPIKIASLSKQAVKAIVAVCHVIDIRIERIYPFSI